MPNEKIELVSSKDSPTGVAGRNVNGNFVQNQGIVPGVNRAPSSADSTVINSASLTPQRDIELPDIPETGNVAGELGRMDAVREQGDQLSQNLQAQQQQSLQGRNDSLFQYAQAQLTAPVRSEIVAQEYARGGDQSVDALMQNVTKYNTELTAEKRALDLKIRRIKENSRGLFGGAMEQEIRNAENESLERQADIAILGMAAQQRWNDAKSIADRSVDARFERQEQEISFYKEMFELNNDLWERDEARSFEVALRDRERRLQDEKETEKLLQDTRLSAMQMAQMNGAPQEIVEAIQNAATPEEVLAKAGQWGSVDMLERAYKRQQIASSRTNQLLALASAGDKSAIAELGFDPSEEPEKLDSTTKRQYKETANATSDLLRMATEYRDLVKQKGYTNEIFGDSKVLGQVNSLRAQMTAAYKDAKKLGTLDQGLLTLMDEVLGEKPTSSIFGIGPEASILGNATGRGSKQIVATMDELIEQTSLENARVSYALGLDPWGDPLNLELPDEVTNQDPLGLIGTSTSNTTVTGTGN